MNGESPWAAKRPIPFMNVSGETIPAFAALAITGVSYESGIAYLLCDKPGTTLVRAYAVNNMFDVPAGLRGTCFRTGDVRVLCDEGTPAAGEGWGPRPGQWSLAQGYPGFTMQGVVDGEHGIAKALAEPIGGLLIKTTAPVASGASTSNYRVYTGTQGSEADAGFTSVPAALNRSGQSLAADEWAWLEWTNNGWELRSTQNRVYPVTLVGAIAAGGSSTVVLPDGRAVNASNWSTDTLLAAGDRCLCWQDFSSGAFYLIKSGGAATDRVWYGVVNQSLPIAAGAAGQVMLSTGVNVAATFHADSALALNGQKVFVWRDPTDDNYYFINADSTASRRFKATIDSGSDLKNGTGSIAVTTIAAFDGGQHPGSVTALNPAKLSAKRNWLVFIEEDWSAAEGTVPDYVIYQTQHQLTEVSTEVEYDATGNRELKHKPRDVNVMWEEDAPGSDTVIFAAENHDILVGVVWDDGSNKKLQYKYRELFTLPNGDASDTTTDILTAVQQQVVQEITVGATVTQVILDAWMFAVGASDSDDLLTLTAKFFVTDVYLDGIDIVKQRDFGKIIDFSANPSPNTVVEGTICDTGDEADSEEQGAMPTKRERRHVEFTEEDVDEFRKEHHTRRPMP